jgi:hypothetical protein
MAIINTVSETLHRIRAKLYPNYLQGIQGAYIARTDDEAALTIEQICAAAKNRGGFTGSYEDMVEHVKHFLDEAAYQLADGFSVNTGYFSLHPRIGGVWESLTESYDPVKHPVKFSFRALRPLREVAKHIEVLIEGLADSGSFIADITDVDTEAVNETLTPGGMFTLTGHKIKVAGDNADCGVYFAEAAGTGQRVQVTRHLADNQSNRIVGIIPALAAGTWTVEVVTQFTGSGSSALKTPRTIKSAAELVVS